MKKLVYFTNRYPFGFDAEWHRTEITALKRVFNEVLIAPLCANQSEIEKGEEGFCGTRVLPPAQDCQSTYFRPRNAVALMNRRLHTRIRDILESRVRFTKNPLKKWVLRNLGVEHAFGNFQTAVLPHLEDASCLYFFWGLGYAEIIPYLTAPLRRRTVVRFHGYDLYADRDDGWIPNQRLIIESARQVLTVSEHGKKYLSTLYPEAASKTHLRHLGCKTGSSPAAWSKDGVFRLVSCAFAQPVKRLHLIPEALRHSKRRIQWTHIGDGPAMPQVREMTAQLPPNIEVIFSGNQHPNAVRDIYAHGTFDLFLNVSESEGIPVSIMEALAAGIPVCATNVGGIPEIVDDRVGILLAKDFTSADLNKAVEKIASLRENEIVELRLACVQRHALGFDSEKNAENLARQLSSL